MTAKAPVRHCAVYTRKSSEEGLEQDFNSLHAQREACEAFIRSQRGEGWWLIETAYDDGGLSGGTLERPALQRLFADIARVRNHGVTTNSLVPSLCSRLRPTKISAGPWRENPGWPLGKKWLSSAKRACVSVRHRPETRRTR